MTSTLYRLTVFRSNFKEYSVPSGKIHIQFNHVMVCKCMKVSSVCKVEAGRLVELIWNDPDVNILIPIAILKSISTCISISISISISINMVISINLTYTHTDTYSHTHTVNYTYTDNYVFCTCFAEVFFPQRKTLSTLTSAI